MKPTVMILGTSHFDNPGMDARNMKMDNVLAPKRQREIRQLIRQLRAFQPTKIALEADERFDAEINANYQGYLEDTYQLTRREGEQIGFRLAKQMRHPKMYCVDYWPEQNPLIPEDLGKDLIDCYTFAKTHNQEHLLSSPPAEGKMYQDKDGTTWIEPDTYEPLKDMFIRFNDPKGRLANHQVYLRSVRIGIGNQYPGANRFILFWYARNLKIFVNLTRIIEAKDDRILLIIGAGHVFLLQQLLENSGDYTVETPLKYLVPQEKK